MSKPVKFLSDNYADIDLAANVIVSSENAAMPIENALAKKRRTKVWRSQGYYNIASGSNTIVFRDDGVTNLTATIAVGEYTSTTSFMAAVDAAFEAVGAANYTITQNSALKFVITSDLSGGATSFELRFGTSTAMAAILGFAATNLTGASTYTADYLRINTEEFVTFDLGLPTSITDFAMIGPRNRSIKLSPTGTFKLQGNTTNSWTSPLYDQTLTYDDEVIGIISETALYTTAPLRYWRVSFSDQNANGYVEVGSFALAIGYSPTRGGIQYGLTKRPNDRSRVVFSEGGQAFADVQEKSDIYTMTWKLLNLTEVEELQSIYQKYGTHYPFFISLDSCEGYSSAFNRQLKYVRFDSDPQITLDSFNNFSMSMTVREDL